MEIIFFLTLLLYIFIIGTCIDFVDYDFFARLIVGKTFFQTGDVLKYDFLSYTPTHPWYDHEWGASVIFYLIQDNFSDIGLYILKAVFLLITFFFFVQIIKLRRKHYNPDKKYQIFNFIFFFIMLQPVFNLVFSLRCHHFTFMFYAIWIYVMEKARLENNYRILWVLPLLMIPWSNIHGGCFMALGVTGLYIIGAILDKKPFLPFVYTLVASFLVMFINPYGFEYVRFLVEATTMSRPNIVEWQPTFGTHFLFKFMKFKILLLAFLILTLIRFRGAYKKADGSNKIDKIKMVWQNLDKTKFVLILVMCLLSLKSIRFITYFIFVLIPFCYDDYYAIFSKELKPKWNKIKELIIFFIMLIIFALNVSIMDFRYGNFHSIFPLTEIEYLIENDIKGNLFVPFECGSYAAYKLYPNNFIYQDGRYEEVYDPDLNDDKTRKIITGDIEWKYLLDSVHHDAIITYKKYDLCDRLKTHPDYFQLLESKTFALFVRKDVYKRMKKPASTPTSRPEFYKNILWHNNINWLKK